MRRNVMLENRGPSGYGLGLKDVDDIVAEGNRFIANRAGLYVDNSPREADAAVRFAHNLFAYNDTGLVLLPLVKRNTYVDNVFLDNDEQIGIATAAANSAATSGRWMAAATTGATTLASTPTATALATCPTSR